MLQTSVRGVYFFCFLLTNFLLHLLGDERDFSLYKQLGLGFLIIKKSATFSTRQI